MQDSIFTKIIKGEIPCHKIYEDDRVIAFLDIHPFTEGHTLVVPKVQVDKIWDLPDDEYENLWNVARVIARHIEAQTGCDRVGVLVKGFDVPHVHIHLLPASRGAGIDFDPHPVPPQADAAELARIAEKLRFS